MSPFRRKPKPTPPPTEQVPLQWRGKTDELVRLSAELAKLAQAAAAGPVQDRLQEFHAELQTHLNELIALTTRSGTLIELTRTLDVEAITAAYKRARRDEDPAADSLQRQHASAQRLLNALDEVDTHLDVAALRARELLLAAGELSLSGSQAALDNARASVELIAAEASALNEAVRSLN